MGRDPGLISAANAVVCEVLGKAPPFDDEAMEGG
jgi:hypothetical protein